MFATLARGISRRIKRFSLLWRKKGAAFADGWPKTLVDPSCTCVLSSPLELEAFFDERVEGRGIWKWRHDFDIYHRHFDSLRKRDNSRDNLVVLEIGIYSGGSLEMWRDYFGSAATIYGVDIEAACRTYESPGTHILIGDQADPLFWRLVLADGTLPPPIS